MSDMWFVKCGVEVAGPFSFDALQEWARDGHLKPENSVRSGTDGPWLFANSVPHLLSRQHARPPDASTRSTTAHSPFKKDSKQSLNTEVHSAADVSDCFRTDASDPQYGGRGLENLAAGECTCGTRLSSWPEIAPGDSMLADADEWYYRAGDRDHGPTTFEA